MLCKLFFFHISLLLIHFCWVSPLIGHTFLLIISPHWSYIFADYLPLLIIHFCWLSPLIDHTFPLIVLASFFFTYWALQDINKWRQYLWGESLQSQINIFYFFTVVSSSNVITDIYCLQHQAVYRNFDR